LQKYSRDVKKIDERDKNENEFPQQRTVMIIIFRSILFIRIHNCVWRKEIKSNHVCADNEAVLFISLLRIHIYILLAFL
jgi:hypothetical protein